MSRRPRTSFVPASCSHSSAGASSPASPSGALSTTATSGRKDCAAARATRDRTARVSGRLIPSRPARSSPTLSRARGGSWMVPTRGGSGCASSIGAPVTMSTVAPASRSVAAPASVSARRTWPRPTHSFVKNRYFSATARPCEPVRRLHSASHQNDTTGGRNLTEQLRSRHVKLFVDAYAPSPSYGRRQPKSVVVTRILRPRPLAHRPVDLEIHALVEEAVEVAHRLGVVLGRGIAPDEVLAPALAEAQMPVRRGALVRAARPPRARLEQLGPDVLGWEVVAGRQRGLVKDLRAPAVREHLVAHEDAHVPRRP